MGERAEEARHCTVHPLHRPRQRRLARRINNYSIYRALRRAIRDCRAEQPILMAPCGYGWFFDRFRQDRIEVVGIDIEPAAVEFARAAVTPPMRVLQGNILEMPFNDGEFDFVISNRFVLHFNAEFRAKAMKELARVTRRHLLVHYDSNSLRQILRRIRGAQEPERDVEHAPGWKKTKRKERKLLYTPEMMAAEGAPAGLRVKELYYVCYMLSDRVYCLYEKAPG
ncbi:MAG: class I SAM-dependent methyltransferase [Planctomycetota bacterium]|nr:class I SAM-dependent methyltransferase [Planctomycetota bacterium]